MPEGDTPLKDCVEYGIFTGKDIYQKVPPREPLIEGIFNKGDNLVISSMPGCGKSILAIQLVCNLTTGTPFLDTYPIPKQRKVLYIQTEGDRAETVQRLSHMLKALKIDDSLWAHYNTPGLTLNTPEGLKEFMITVKQTQLEYEVIIIDPLYPTVKGSLSSDDIVTDWQRSTRMIRETYKQVSFVLFHHDSIKENWQNGKLIGKALDDIFGSSMWPAWMSANYKMRMCDGIHQLRGGKGGGYGRSGHGISAINMRLIEPTPLYYVIDESGLNETQIKVLTLLKADPQKKFTRKQLETVLDKTKPTVCRALLKLLEDKRIDKLEDDNIIYYAIKKDP
jgi:hypothetical protein